MARKKTQEPAAATEAIVTEAAAAAAADSVDTAAAPDLAAQLATSQAAVAENRDLYLRALADLENYRKRAQRDREDAIRFANDNLLRDILPVLDNLERALDHAGDDAGQKVLREGVEMTLGQLRKVLESAGVSKISAAGLPFDPNFHQAMGQVETGEQPVNTVVQVLQSGYLLRERLLRPAMVLIAKAPAAPADDVSA